MPELPRGAELAGAIGPGPGDGLQGAVGGLALDGRNSTLAQISEIAVRVGNAQAGDDTRAAKVRLTASDHCRPSTPGAERGSGRPCPSCAPRTGSMGKARSARIRAEVSGSLKNLAKSIAASRCRP